MHRTVLAGLILGALVSNFSKAGTLDFNIATYNVAENASSFVVTINRSGNLSASASVTVKSTDGTAEVAADYQNMSQVVSWTAGDSEPKNVTVNILDDRLVESTENFQLDLINPVGDVVGTVGSATVSITDYEEGTLQFTAAVYEFTEDVVLAEVFVERQFGTDGEVSVDFATLDDLALQGQDYVNKSGTLDFADGENSHRITLGLIDDEIGEIEQSFGIVLTSVAGGALLGTTTTTEVVIVDDDPDFTPALSTLLLEVQQTIQVEAVDLSQTSLTDAGKTLLDTVNELPVLSTTDLVGAQSTSGQIIFNVGDNVFFFRPLSVLRAAESSEIGIFLLADNSGFFRTAEGVNIHFHPALTGLAVLQSELAELELPELTVDNFGNITVQSDQGPPPLEMDENGKLVINNSFYDRYNVRPLSVARPSTAEAEGTVFEPHPVFPQEFVLVVNARHDNQMRRQMLTSAPIDAVELVDELLSQSGIVAAEILDYSIIEYSTGGLSYRLFPDYIIRRVEDFTVDMVGISFPGDVNLDGQDDIRMIFSNGDEQFFYIHPWE